MAFTVPKLAPSSEPAKRNYIKKTGHDNLHMLAGLEYCWCMYKKCWRPSFKTSEGNQTGECICPDCPCHIKAFLEN